MKNIQDLRKILFEEIDALRAGTTNAANVNAVTNATGKVLSSFKLELEYRKLMGKQPDGNEFFQIESSTNSPTPEPAEVKAN